jgi:hypothetical protein
MAKINQKVTRFVSGLVKLTLIHRTGKNGISVFARITKPGQMSTIGARSVFLPAETVGAEKAYAALIADAQKKGYVTRVVTGGPAATKFDSIPSPSEVPDGLPLKGSKKLVKAGPKAVVAHNRAVAR